MGILNDNLEELRKKDGWLAGRIAAHQGACVSVETAKSGEPTFSLNGRLFHSAYDPVKEAASQAEEILSKKPDHVLLFGLGCGHLLQAIVSKGHKKVLVYEPSQEILNGVMRGVDFTTALANPDVWVADDMQVFISKIRDLDGFDNLLCFSTNPYKLTFPNEFSDFMNRVRNAHITNKVSIKTDIDSREMWINNYFSNMKSMPGCPPIDVLKGAFRGMPMIIAGAGPSLKKNAHLLKEAKGKAVIVAAITAYKPLLSYGVVPDFIIAAEKVDLPEYFTYGEEDLKTRLILAEVSHPAMFDRKVKEKFVFFNPYLTHSSGHSSLWGSDYFPAIGGSVTTAALDMGVMFGCSPIVFIGQDLSFGEGETHAKGGVYVSQDIKMDREKGEVTIDENYVTLKDKVSSSFKLLWLKGLDGKPVPSKFDWVTFHQWFENYMAAMKKVNAGINVINATEGGAYIEGMEHLTLSEVIEEYMKNGIDLEASIEGARASMRQPDIQGLISSLESMKMRLKEIGKTADSILKETASIKRSLASRFTVAEMHSAVEKIKRLEDRLYRAAEDSPFIWETLTPYTYKLKEYLRGEPDGKSPEELLKGHAEAIAASYRQVSGVCARYAPVLEVSAEYLKGPVKDADGASAASR